MLVSGGDARNLESLDGHAHEQCQKRDPGYPPAMEQQGEQQIASNSIKNIAEALIIQKPADRTEAGQQTQSYDGSQCQEKAKHTYGFIAQE